MIQEELHYSIYLTELGYRKAGNISVMLSAFSCPRSRFSKFGSGDDGRGTDVPMIENTVKNRYKRESCNTDVSPTVYYVFLELFDTS